MTTEERNAATIAIYKFTDGKITERWCPQPPGVLEQLGLGDDHLAG